MNLFETVKSLKDQGFTWNQIAHSVKHLRNFENGNSLRLWYRRERYKMHSLDLATSEIEKVPVSLPQPFDDVLNLSIEEGSSVLIMADLHVPYHHEEFIATALQLTLKNYKLNHIIVAGDLFTFDQISKYSKSHNLPKMETELELGGSMLMFLAEHAPLFITNSNHDARFATKIDVQFSLKRLMNAALNGRKPKNKIETTERDYMFLNNDVIVGHLTNATAVAGKIAHNIAQKYQRHCLAGHDHITGVYNPRSRYIGASIGCAAEFKKFWYSEKNMTPFKVMQRGYAVVTGQTCGTKLDLYNQANMLYYSRSVLDNGVYQSKIVDQIDP